MSVNLDYRELLWQQLDKNFATGNDQVFVMSVGKFLQHSDYSLAKGNEKVAAYKTFELTDNCIGCGRNYNPTGQKISTLWDTLLNQGQGPPAGPAQQAAFEEAKSTLFKVWKTQTPTEYYQNYLDAESAYQEKETEMEAEYEKNYGDRQNWIQRYNKEIKKTPEYRTFDRLHRNVAPMLKAIDVWRFGPLADSLAPMKQAFEDNKREVYIGVNCHKYMNVSMTPSNWYEWFNPDALQDSAWITITVDEKSFDATQDKNYKKLGGSVKAGYSFLGIEAGVEGSKEKRIATEGNWGIKISFKVRTVQINRPWVSPSALRIQNWKVPGLAPGAWSTGVLDSSNNGVFPLLTTQLIVAKDIKVTADKFSQEVTDTLTKFDGKVGAGTIFGLFSFGLGIDGGKASKPHSLRFDQKENSITLEGTQVIGYTATLMPKYPV